MDLTSFKHQPDSRSLEQPPSLGRRDGAGHLARIEEKDKDVRSYLSVCPDRALAKAEG